ncbi:hypothetical protein BKA64DRAFT_579793, partial [Cadophora sp. MPI-SDFR-AT-0126]
WNALLQTLEGHLSFVYLVAFSPDSKQVVSRSSNTIDAAIGALLQMLKGYSDFISSIAFSPKSN